MTVTVEHVATEHSGHGVTPRYRCDCGQVHSSPQAAFDCRHPMPDRHEPAQLTLEVEP